jgi:hypothetical protein
MSPGAAPDKHRHDRPRHRHYTRPPYTLRLWHAWRQVERLRSPPAPHRSRFAGKSLLTAHTTRPIIATANTIRMRSGPSWAYTDMVSTSSQLVLACLRHVISGDFFTQI